MEPIESSAVAVEPVESEWSTIRMVPSFEKKKSAPHAALSNAVSRAIASGSPVFVNIAPAGSDEVAEHLAGFRHGGAR